MANNKNKQNKTKAQIQSAVDTAVSRLVSNSNGGTARRKNRRRGGGAQVGIAVGSNITTGSPTFVAGSGGNVVVTNQEYLRDVTNDAPVTGFDVNPGSSTTFPWLSRVAQNFEMFRFRRLEFRYQSACPTTTQGVLIMAFDYDASDAPPASKQQMASYAGATRANIWSNCSMALKCPSSWSYVGNLTGQINPKDTDIKLYDVAKAYYGVFNGLNNLMVGELYVSYTVELTKPNWEVPIATSGYVSFSSSTRSNIFGTSQTVVGDIPLNVYTQLAGSDRHGIIEFPKRGTYLLDLVIKYSASIKPSGWYGGMGVIHPEYAKENPSTSTDYPDVPVLEVVGEYLGADVHSHIFISLYVDTTIGNFVRLLVPLAVTLSTFQLIKTRISYYKKTIEPL